MTPNSEPKPTLSSATPPTRRSVAQRLDVTKTPRLSKNSVFQPAGHQGDRQDELKRTTLKRWLGVRYETG
jgi:hypothetical protein